MLRSGKRPRPGCTALEKNSGLEKRYGKADPTPMSTSTSLSPAPSVFGDDRLPTMLLVAILQHVAAADPGTVVMVAPRVCRWWAAVIRAHVSLPSLSLCASASLDLRLVPLLSSDRRLHNALLQFRGVRDLRVEGSAALTGAGLTSSAPLDRSTMQGLGASSGKPGVSGTTTPSTPSSAPPAAAPTVSTAASTTPSTTRSTTRSTVASAALASAPVAVYTQGTLMGSVSRHYKRRSAAARTTPLHPLQQPHAACVQHLESLSLVNCGALEDGALTALAAAGGCNSLVRLNLSLSLIHI